MEVSVCALAKMENAYINDWVRYHLELGFDRIWLYDNNDFDYPYVGGFISDEFKDRVTIVDWRDRQFKNHTPNKEVYDDWLKSNGDEYDWCAFIDIDEFIHIGERKLKEWLAGVPSQYDGVILNWHVIGDDGIIEGDEKVPVCERLFNQVPTHDNMLFKTILRCSRNMETINPHIFKNIEGDVVKCCDCIYKEPIKGLNTFIELRDYDCWINHYATKTVSEFVKYKLPRLNKEHFSCGSSEYFFLYNERSAEKEKILNSYIL